MCNSLEQCEKTAIAVGEQIVEVAVAGDRAIELCQPRCHFLPMRWTKQWLEPFAQPLQQQAKSPLAVGPRAVRHRSTRWWKLHRLPFAANSQVCPSHPREGMAVDPAHRTLRRLANVRDDRAGLERLIAHEAG
jgi:hypothetical protein